MGSSSSSLQGLTVEQIIQLIGEYLMSRNMTVQTAFSFLDVDASGHVTWEEFLRGFRLCVEGMGSTFAVTPQALMPVFSRFDMNGDGRISIQEFSQAFAPRTGPGQTYHDHEFYARTRQSPGMPSRYTSQRLQPAEMERKTANNVIARIAASVARLGYSPQSLFYKLDMDGNGRLSCAEIEKVCVSMQPDLSRTEKEAIFHFFDRDGSMSVDVREFCQALEQVNANALLAVEDKVKMIGARFKEQGHSIFDAFLIFDRNGDGFLTLEEWQRAMNSLGSAMSPEDSASVFRRFDMDGNGYMNIHEFEQFFQDTIQRATPITQLSPNSLPVQKQYPVEAAWEVEVLDLVRSCLSPARSGMSISEVFRRLDLSRTNSLSMYEFKRMVLTYRPDLTDAQLEQLFYKVNLSKNGAISLGEFTRRFG